MAQTSTARLYDDDLDRIHDLKGRGESVADVVSDLLDEREERAKDASTA